MQNSVSEKNFKNKKGGICMWKIICKALDCLFIIAIDTALNWALFCGIFKLISICLPMDFDLKVVTGFWLVVILCRFVLKAKE